MGDSKTSRRKVLGAVCELQSWVFDSCDTNFQVGAFLGLVYHRKWGEGGRLHDLLVVSATFRFKVVYFFVLAVFVVANFLKFVIFGRLTSNEVRILTEKAGYTAWEFVFGFLVFYTSTGSFLDIYSEAAKFAGLFLCVLLVKCFHYLTADRVHTVYCSSEEGAGAVLGYYVYLRLGLGIFLLNLVDGLLIYKYCYDVILQNYVQHNVLITIFGFEILNHCPLTLSTSFQFCLNTYEVNFVEKKNYEKWKHRKLRITFVTEFVLNLARFAMSCVFSLLFMYYYTFPVHMVPSSYTSLKAAVLKTRTLLDFRIRELRFQSLKVPAFVKSDEKCIICFDELVNAPLETTRCIPTCQHAFHSECIQLWLDYSPTCPVCRQKI